MGDFPSFISLFGPWKRRKGKEQGGSLEGEITFSETNKQNYKLNITQNAPTKIIKWWLLLCHRKHHEPNAERSMLPCHSTLSEWIFQQWHHLALHLLSAAPGGITSLWMTGEGPPCRHCTHHVSSFLFITRPFSHVFGFNCNKCTGDQTHTGSELTKKTPSIIRQSRGGRPEWDQDLWHPLWPPLPEGCWAL